MTNGERPVPEKQLAESPLKRPDFRRMLAISITVALGFGMVIPVLPDYARSFGVTAAVAGLVQFVFGFTRFSFGLGAGLVVDRFGERATTMAGILIVALSSYAMGFAQTFPQLVAARGFGGVGSAMFITGLMARILRIIEPSAMGRATGTFRASFLVGTAMGPLMGGVVAEAFGNTAVFHIYATGLLIATVIAYFVMTGAPGGSAEKKRSPMESLRAAKPLLRDPRYIAALAATFAGWWTLSGPAQFVGTLFAEDVLDFSKSTIGLAFTLLAAGELAVLFMAGRAADRYGRKAVMVPALAIAAVCVALIGQTEPVPWAFFPLMMAVGAGIAASGAAGGGLLADAIPRTGSGAAIGVNQMAGDLGYMVAPSALGGMAEGISFQGAYVLGALPAALGCALALRLPGHDKPVTDPSKIEAQAPDPVG